MIGTTLYTVLTHSHRHSHPASDRDNAPLVYDKHDHSHRVWGLHPTIGEYAHGHGHDFQEEAGLGRTKGPAWYEALHPS